MNATDDSKETESVKIEIGLASLVSSSHNEAEAPTSRKDELVDSQPTCIQTFGKKLCKFYSSNPFLILAALAILLAFAYPPLGAVYLAPHITATWVAVIIIFFLSGLSLKSEEFAKAFQRLRFNLFVQIFNFGIVSVIVYGFSRLIVTIGLISQSLADGMVIGSCVPITVNMVLVLTKSSGGDEAAAVFNAAFGNILGIFLSPVLILLYLGQRASVDIGNVFYKLSLRVLLPIAVGQLFHKFSPVVMNFVKKYKVYFKKIQEYCLICIIYTVFCTTFSTERDSSAVDAILMIIFQFLILSTVMVLAWFALMLFFRDQPKLRVMGLFGCTHKSVAVGIPLINAIYEDNPNIGLYTLPLLIWHPMQLVIGTFLAPRLAKFVEREEGPVQTLPEMAEEEGNIEDDEERKLSDICGEIIPIDDKGDKLLIDSVDVDQKIK